MSYLKKIFLTLIVVMSLSNVVEAKGGIGGGRAAVSAGRAVVRTLPKSIPKASVSISKTPTLNAIKNPSVDISKNLPKSSVTGAIAQQMVKKPGQTLIKALVFSLIAGCLSDRVLDCTEGLTSSDYGDISASEFERE